MATPIRTLTASVRPPTCATCGHPTTSRARQVESIAHCPNCGEDVCWLDGQRLLSHDRCAACQVLVGPHHASTHLRDGLCPSCYRRRAKGRPVERDEPEPDWLTGSS
jgi:predicted RNA-binding Zn-ribbon protein involved in translation (DUF1610 family)